MHILAARLPAHSLGAELVSMLASPAKPSEGTPGDAAEVYNRLCMCLTQAATHSRSQRLLRIHLSAVRTSGLSSSAPCMFMK